jgi:hypothetical protein
MWMSMGCVLYGVGMEWVWRRVLDCYPQPQEPLEGSQRDKTMMLSLTMIVVESRIVQIGGGG